MHGVTISVDSFQTRHLALVVSYVANVETLTKQIDLLNAGSHVYRVSVTELLSQKNNRSFFWSRVKFLNKTNLKRKPCVLSTRNIKWIPVYRIGRIAVSTVFSTWHERRFGGKLKKFKCKSVNRKVSSRSDAVFKSKWVKCDPPKLSKYDVTSSSPKWLGDLRVFLRDAPCFPCSRSWQCGSAWAARGPGISRAPARHKKLTSILEFEKHMFFFCQEWNVCQKLCRDLFQEFLVPEVDNAGDFNAAGRLSNRGFKSSHKRSLISVNNKAELHSRMYSNRIFLTYFLWCSLLIRWCSY